ncbi:MAG: Bax inhibitor-1/YccA family protein [Bowdeniella nasicola]|nr:Bax inhibitor-1/YccA family protein [Bowdeniella nasicola]
MANPYFSSAPAFSDQGGKTPAGYPAMPGYQVGAHPTPPDREQQTNAISARDLHAHYQQPAASALETGRMTLDDAIMKTGIVLGTIVAVAALHWIVIGPSALLTYGGLAAGFVLGLINAVKRVPSPALIMAYAVAEGAFLGGISAMFEAAFQGIVSQAILATIATFAVCLVLYKTGTVRVSARSTRLLLIAMLGYLVFSLVNLVLMATGVSSGSFGLRSVTIMGIPLGIVIGIFAVFLAAWCLIQDFDSIEQGIARGLPHQYAWGAAFGIAVTLVWMYLEFLRILAIFRD